MSRAALVAAVAVTTGCANILPPPGGPPDVSPPQLVATAPDSLAVLPAFEGEVEFRFNEVISEGAAAQTGGGGDLARLVILSPSEGVPEVRWRRSRITVRPGNGWQPNRVYRVELLPGVTDLRNNRAVSTAAGRVVTFTTGAPIPTAMLRGTVLDWSTGRAAPGALVEAVLLPDSLPYRMVADSGGRFALGPLPPAAYLVFGVIDQDADHARDPREPFDSVRIAAGAGDSLRLWAFTRDSTGPRIRDILVVDSVTATVSFTQLLDPAQTVDRAAVSLVRLPDSTPVPVLSLTRRAPGDTAATVPAGMRAPLSDQLVLRTGLAWLPGTRYALRVRAIRNASGVAGDATGVIDAAERARPLPAPGVPSPPVTPPRQK